ncbi:hypothetical protein D3C81_1966080 [compost metagenome]
MKEWHDTSIARAKPSADELSSPPWRSAFGAKATECTMASSRPHCSVMRANSAAICASSSTFSGMKMEASTCAASGATCGCALSLR